MSGGRVADGDICSSLSGVVKDTVSGGEFLRMLSPVMCSRWAL